MEEDFFISISYQVIGCISGENSSRQDCLVWAGCDMPLSSKTVK